MFPIVNNLNTLASSVNGLRAEVRQLQAAQQDAILQQASSQNTNQTNAVVAIPLLQQQQTNLDDAFKRVSSQTVQTMQGLVDVKRQLETIKAEMTREIGMLETMILRKCEVTMHKMINDKIAVALDAQRSGLKDRVALETRAVADSIKTELAQLRMHVDTAVAASANQNSNPPVSTSKFAASPPRGGLPPTAPTAPAALQVRTQSPAPPSPAASAEPETLSGPDDSAFAPAPSHASSGEDLATIEALGAAEEDDEYAVTIGGGNNAGNTNNSTASNAHHSSSTKGGKRGRPNKR